MVQQLSIAIRAAVLVLILSASSCNGQGEAPPGCTNTSTPAVDTACLAGLYEKFAEGVLPSNLGNSEVFSNVSSSILSCLGSGVQGLRPIRILSPNQNEQVLPPLLEIYKNMTGYSVIVDYRDIDALPGIVLDQTQGKRVYDGWILDPITMVDMIAEDFLEPLDAYIQADPSIEWTSDVNSYFRAISSVYDGDILGLPLAGKISVMYYRRDVFALAGLPPPSTWEELIFMAQKLNGSDFNGDGVGDYAVCMQVNQCLENSVVLSQMLAPMTQYQGLQTGWLFDPDTMDPLIHNEAMLTAMSNFLELRKYMWPGPECNFVHVEFVTGRCAISIKWDEQFKFMQLVNLLPPSLIGPNPLFNVTPNPWHGAIGFAQLPGSTRVLNRTSGKLVPCTDTAMCPYAVPLPDLATGKTQLVNRAPHFGLAGFAGFVNKLQPSGYKQATYGLFSFISSPAVSVPLVIAFSPVGPYRNSHLDASPTAIQRWVTTGYSGSDVKDFLAVNLQTIGNPANVALDVRVLNGYQYRMAISSAVQMLVNRTSADTTMAWLTSRFQQIRAASPLGFDKFKASYWAGLNRQLPPPTPPPPPPPAPPPQPPPFESSSHGLSAGGIVGVAVGSAALVAILAAAALLFGKVFNRSLFWSHPPKVGPGTTLLVTDIQDSTLMWETVPQETMNLAVELHHGLVRKLLRKHRGYESATEGDSFILSFFSAADALAFGQAFQAGLLVLPYPDELLAHPLCSPVWVVPKAQAKREAGAETMSRGQHRALTSIGPFTSLMKTTSMGPHSNGSQIMSVQSAVQHFLVGSASQVAYSGKGPASGPGYSNPSATVKATGPLGFSTPPASNKGHHTAPNKDPAATSNFLMTQAATAVAAPPPPPPHHPAASAAAPAHTGITSTPTTPSGTPTSMALSSFAAAGAAAAAPHSHTSGSAGHTFPTSDQRSSPSSRDPAPSHSDLAPHQHGAVLVQVNPDDLTTDTQQQQQHTAPSSTHDRPGPSQYSSGNGAEGGAVSDLFHWPVPVVQQYEDGSGGSQPRLSPRGVLAQQPSSAHPPPHHQQHSPIQQQQQQPSFTHDHQQQQQQQQQGQVMSPQAGNPPGAPTSHRQAALQQLTPLPQASSVPVPPAASSPSATALGARYGHLSPPGALHNNSSPGGSGTAVGGTSFTTGTTYPWAVLQEAGNSLGNSGLSSAQPSSSAFAMPSVTTLLSRHGSNAEGLLIRHGSNAEGMAADLEDGPRSLVHIGVSRVAGSALKTAGTAFGTGTGTAGTAGSTGSNTSRPAGSSFTIGASRLSTAEHRHRGAGPGPVAEGVEQYNQRQSQGHYNEGQQYNQGQGHYNQGHYIQALHEGPVAEGVEAGLVGGGTPFARESAGVRSPAPAGQQYPQQQQRLATITDYGHSLETEGSQEAKRFTITAYPARQYYQNLWEPLPQGVNGDLVPNARLVFRGLRVRLGMHSGIHESSDAVFNKTSGRVMYGGLPLATAKAVGDCGQGGMVLLSQAAYERLPVSSLPQYGLLMNMGDYVFRKDASVPPTPIYQAVAQGMEPRAGLLPGPLRATEQLQAGLLDAPLGDVTIAFCNLVGASTLLAWDRALGQSVLDIYQVHAVTALQSVTSVMASLAEVTLHAKGGGNAAGPEFGRQSLGPSGAVAGVPKLSAIAAASASTGSVTGQGMVPHPGYLVELSGGLCLAGFLNPVTAMLWGLQLMANLKSAAWSDAILSHELCEEVTVQERAEHVGLQGQASGAMTPGGMFHNSMGAHQTHAFTPSRVSHTGTNAAPDQSTMLGSALQQALTAAVAGNSGSGSAAVPGAHSGHYMAIGSTTIESALIEGGASFTAGAHAPTSREFLRRKVTGHDIMQSGHGHMPRMRTRVLFRGPRLKIGVDVGRAHADINPVTGRMTYRGRLMNRAARIAEKASSGALWCSQAAWMWCAETCAEGLVEFGIEAKSLGSYHLKGVSEQMSLFRVSQLPGYEGFARPMSDSHDLPAMSASYAAVGGTAGMPDIHAPLPVVMGSVTSVTIDRVSHLSRGSLRNEGLAGGAGSTTGIIHTPFTAQGTTQESERLSLQRHTIRSLHTLQQRAALMGSRKGARTSVTSGVPELQSQIIYGGGSGRRTSAASEGFAEQGITGILKGSRGHRRTADAGTVLSPSARSMNEPPHVLLGGASGTGGGPPGGDRMGTRSMSSASHRSDRLPLVPVAGSLTSAGLSGSSLTHIRSGRERSITEAGGNRVFARKVSTSHLSVTTAPVGTAPQLLQQQQQSSSPTRLDQVPGGDASAGGAPNRLSVGDNNNPLQVLTLASEPHGMMATLLDGIATQQQQQQHHSSHRHHHRSHQQQQGPGQHAYPAPQPFSAAAAAGDAYLDPMSGTISSGENAQSSLLLLQQSEQVSASDHARDTAAAITTIPVGDSRRPSSTRGLQYSGPHGAAVQEQDTSSANVGNTHVSAHQYPIATSTQGASQDSSHAPAHDPIAAATGSAIIMQQQQQQHPRQPSAGPHSPRRHSRMGPPAPHTFAVTFQSRLSMDRESPGLMGSRPTSSSSNVVGGTMDHGGTTTGTGTTRAVSGGNVLRPPVPSRAYQQSRSLQERSHRLGGHSGGQASVGAAAGGAAATGGGSAGQQPLVAPDIARSMDSTSYVLASTTTAPPPHTSGVSDPQRSDPEISAAAYHTLVTSPSGPPVVLVGTGNTGGDVAVVGSPSSAAGGHTSSYSSSPREVTARLLMNQNSQGRMRAMWMRAVHKVGGSFVERTPSEQVLSARGKSATAASVGVGAPNAAVGGSRNSATDVPPIAAYGTAYSMTQYTGNTLSASPPDQAVLALHQPSMQRLHQQLQMQDGGSEVDGVAPAVNILKAQHQVLSMRAAHQPGAGPSTGGTRGSAASTILSSWLGGIGRGSRNQRPSSKNSSTHPDDGPWDRALRGHNALGHTSGPGRADDEYSRHEGEQDREGEEEEEEEDTAGATFNGMVID